MSRERRQALAFLSLATAITLGSAAIGSAQTRLDFRQATAELVRRQIASDAAASKPSSASTGDAAWARLRTLSPGAKVQVEAVNAAEVKGRLRSVQDDAITVQTDAGDWRVLRADVRRVRVPNSGKRVLFGAIGAATGALLPFIACPYCANEGHSITAQQVSFGALGSLLAFAPQTSTIYNAPGKQ